MRRPLSHTGRVAEEWRAAHGYPDYEVSSLGYVRTRSTKRVLKQYISHGRHKVHIIRDRAEHSHHVDTIVASTFIRRIPAGHKVIHKGSGLNDCADNLMIVPIWPRSTREQIENAIEMADRGVSRRLIEKMTGVTRKVIFRERRRRGAG